LRRRRLRICSDQVDETDQRLGNIDILVNNAGIIEPIGALVQSDPAAWRRSTEVNLVGAYHTAHATLPRMLGAGKGTVINISSGAAHHPLEGWSAYCSAKAGLAILTSAIALEHSRIGWKRGTGFPGEVKCDSLLGPQDVGGSDGLAAGAELFGGPSGAGSGGD